MVEGLPSAVYTWSAIQLSQPYGTGKNYNLIYFNLEEDEKIKYELYHNMGSLTLFYLHFSVKASLHS
jgi:hypothetical protein